MLSFIVIGLNEGWKLTKCFQSIFETIKKSNLAEYEVIYVDSNSSDDSIQSAKKFNAIKIFKITGEANAAIARNIGAKESTGDVLFFIDGDMEIIPKALDNFYDSSNGLAGNFISGQYINYFYNQNGELLSKNIYDKSLKSKDKYYSITGGLFLIKRKCWFLVNGMKNKYKKSQDLDFALRLSKKQIKLLRKKELLAIHHTISFRSKNRLWKMLVQKSFLYGKSMLYRDHIININIYPLILRNDYTIIILLFSVFLALFFSRVEFTLIYIFFTLIRSVFVAKKEGQSILTFFLYYLFRDIVTIVGFFVFFPHRNSKIKYLNVK